MDAKIERRAAEALLDAGLSIPIKSIHIPFRKKAITLRITLHRPYLGTQIRIARRFLKMGVKYADLQDLDKEGEEQFLATHGKALSRIVADTLWRGRFSSWLLGGLTSSLLLRYVEGKYLLVAVSEYALLDDISVFANIIRLVEGMNPMKPRLSQGAKGS